ncbi:ARM repeat-containing protein [Fistulina hepatica ATCC 64428]|nr:ARM repeat-containing protein [Fistulina hepatica ATCC 64428]
MDVDAVHPERQRLSPSQVYDAVAASVSQDATQIKAATERLQSVLKDLDYLDILHEIAAQKSVPLNVRKQAIIQCKNVVEARWRSRLIKPEQRARIRNRCLAFLDETDETIAKSNQTIVRKISRIDYPQEWPNLITDLLNTIRQKLQRRYVVGGDDGEQVVVLQRSLGLLKVVLKEFWNFKMIKGVKIMKQLVIQNYVDLLAYHDEVSSLLNASTINPEAVVSPRVQNDIIIADTLFKCVVLVTTFVFNQVDRPNLPPEEKPHFTIGWINNMFQRSVVRLQSLVELRASVVANLPAGVNNASPLARSIQLLTHYIKHYGKFYHRLQTLNRQRFSEMPMCSDMILFYWGQVELATKGNQAQVRDDDLALFPTRFLVQGLVIFNENLTQWTPTRRDGTPNKNFLSDTFVANAVRVLISRFMPLSPSDLESWTESPEDWVNEEATEQWMFQIRPCSERVMTRLGNQYPHIVAPLIKESFQQHLQSSSSGDLQSIVQKEALYCALGRCAPKLQDQIDFIEWLQAALVSEAQSSNPNYPIIKRRIAWLIGQWTSTSSTTPNNPLLWETLVYLLRDRGLGSDLAVRLTAAISLRECVDAQTLAPYLSTVVQELMSLISESDTLEGKRRISLTLNTVIERMQERIVPHMDRITAPIPQLWLNSGTDTLFKGTLLDTVRCLIEAVKTESTPLCGLVVSLVQECSKPQLALNLDEDALNLWLTALRNTVTFHDVNGQPGLLQLLPHALRLLREDLDLLGSLVYIIESYLLLGGAEVLQLCAVELLEAFRMALSSHAVTTNLRDLVAALELLVQVTPPSAWGEAMHLTGLFERLLDTLVDNEAPTLFLTEHIYLFSRIVIADRQIFTQLMTATASRKQVLGKTMQEVEANLYDLLLDQWWGRFDNMSEPFYRKLTAMGAASLAATGRPDVLKRLPTEFFNIWLDVFGELKEARLRQQEFQADGVPLLSPDNFLRHWEVDNAPRHYFPVEEDVPEYSRRRAVFDADPVRTQQLSDYVGQRLRETEAKCGSEAFQELYLSKADPTVLLQVQDAIQSS